MPNINNGLAILSNAARSMTEDSGIYKMISNSGEVLYIGKAKSLAKRVQQYTQIGRLPNRLKLMVSLVSKVEIVVTKSEEEALFLEADLIKGLKPRFNIALKDDKSFPYIALDNHKFPRIFKYRGSQKSGVKYFGPFMNAEALDEILVMVQKIFQVRSCTDKYFAQRQRPCLLYQIKRCSAPCVQKIDEQEYIENIKQVRKFLSGDIEATRKIFLIEMESASNNLEFEEAARYRDKVRLLAHLGTQSLRYNGRNHEEIDIFAFYIHQMRCCVQIFSIRSGKNIGNTAYFLESIGEYDEVMQSFIVDYYHHHLKPKKIAIMTENSAAVITLKALLKIQVLPIKRNDSNAQIYAIARKNAEIALNNYLKTLAVKNDILQQMKQVFYLEQIPSRIEVYDNSHIQGQYAVGCMVVHDGQEFVKSEYRIFKMSKDVKEGDDYGMMKQSLTRRFTRSGEKNYPELILIDGGKNHLKVALNVLDSLAIKHVRAIAIAKGEKRNAGGETFFLDDGQVINFPDDDKLLYFLQRLRDEVHRFAVTPHRALRKKETLKSLTINLPGVGAKREKLLLSIFGSYEKIKNATLEDFKKVPSIGEKLALSLYNYLHSGKVS